MKKMIDNSNSVLLHIPTHDGRGFGFAPKAETEIYKLGGKGKIHEVVQRMDTISAAKLLYSVQDESYDIRDYKGASYILKFFGYDNVTLHTDNRRKVEELEENGIRVEREETQTHKESCAHHIAEKHNDTQYYNSKEENYK